MEHAVGAQLAVGQRLRAVLERVRQRVDAVINHFHLNALPRKREVDVLAFARDGMSHHVAADANPFVLGAGAHLADFLDVLVVGLGVADAVHGKPPKGAQDRHRKYPEFHVLAHRDQAPNYRVFPSKLKYTSVTFRAR